MKDVDIIGSYWTLSGGALPHTDHEYSTFDFKDRVQSAARAGFKGIGLWHADLEYILRTRTLKEMKQILDDNGIKHLELEFLTDWFWEDERRKASDKNRKMLMEAAEGAEGEPLAPPLPPLPPLPAPPAPSDPRPTRGRAWSGFSSRSG